MGQVIGGQRSLRARARGLDGIGVLFRHKHPEETPVPWVRILSQSLHPRISLCCRVPGVERDKRSLLRNQTSTKQRPGAGGWGQGR